MIRQKRGFIRVESEILPIGVRMKQKDLFNEYGTVVPFQHISDQIVREFNVSKLYLFICVVMLALFLFNGYDYLYPEAVADRQPATLKDMVVSFIWLIAASFGTWVRSISHIGVGCIGGNIMLLDLKGKNNPSEYINEIMRARDEYFEKMQKAEQSLPSEISILDESKTIH